MSLVKKILSNQQLLRFGLVGGVNTALDFGLLFIFTFLGLPVTLANILSTGIAFIFSFFANKKYTFKTSGTNILREVLLFVGVTLFGLWVLQTVVIALLHAPLTALIDDSGLALLLAKLVATIVSLTGNYILYSKVVFRKTQANPIDMV